MRDFIKPHEMSGHFKIEAVKDNKVIDVYADENMIMDNASVTMSELFANLNSSTFINEIRFGTMGHVGTNILQPKLPADGLIKARDRLFCESGSTAAQPTNINTNLTVLNTNDIFYVNTTVLANAGYYRYMGLTTTNYTVTDAEVLNVTVWEPLGTTTPYIYHISFTIPGTALDLTNGDLATNIQEDTTSAGSSVRILQTGTSVSFIVDVSTSGGNSQFLNYSVFTEAALYANGRIFALKTFKSKIKDTTISLRVTWKITF